jgi:hypothetical protein
LILADTMTIRKCGRKSWTRDRVIAKCIKYKLTDQHTMFKFACDNMPTDQIFKTGIAIDQFPSIIGMTENAKRAIIRQYYTDNIDALIFENPLLCGQERDVKLLKECYNGRYGDHLLKDLVTLEDCMDVLWYHVNLPKHLASQDLDTELPVDFYQEATSLYSTQLSCIKRARCDDSIGSSSIECYSKRPRMILV